MPPSVAEILRAIKKKHVTAAIQYIDRVGHVPKRRNSTKFAVITRQRRLYPPKYLLFLAAQRATGHELKPEEHSGGRQSNETLERLKFKIISRPTTWPEK